MIDVNELPATLPGTIKDQLLALAPYMTDRTLKSNGGFIIDMKIPIEAFVTFDINHAELNKNCMSLSVQVEQPEDIGFSGTCGHVIRHKQYVDAQLTYK
jgi:hypothetical protein